MRHTAVSIPVNIAEGFKKRTIPDKLRFLNFAGCSLEESRYYLILSNDLSYAKTNELKMLIEEVSRMLTAYIKAIESED